MTYIIYASLVLMNVLILVASPGHPSNAFQYLAIGFVVGLAAASFMNDIRRPK